MSATHGNANLLRVALKRVAVAVLVALAGALGIIKSTSNPDRVTDCGGQGVAALLRGGRPAFIPNLGQWDWPVRFVARAGPATVFLDERGWILDLREARADGRVRGVALRMTFEGSAGARPLAGDGKRYGRHSYFLGRDPSRWRTAVPAYGAVRYRGLYPGIDVVMRESDGHPEYDLLLEPGADLGQIRVRVEGAAGLHLDDKGSLVIETAIGEVTQAVPDSWESRPGGKTEKRSCAYVLLNDDTFAFDVGGWDGGQPLTIDPGLVWSTYLGAAGKDEAEALAVDGRGVVTMAGSTDSLVFPTRMGPYSSHAQKRDAFVSRLVPWIAGSAQLVQSTYFGGSEDDAAFALSVDARGVVTIAGTTESPDLPTTAGAYATFLGGQADAFVSRLDLTRSGSAQLVYSTFLGGGFDDFEVARALSVDPNGVVSVAGVTRSANFPTTAGAYATSFAGALDGFVSRLDPSRVGAAQLVHSTYLGGSGWDEINALDIDIAGAVVVAGVTGSANYPITTTAYPRRRSGLEAFVSRLDPRKTGPAQLTYSVLVGSAVVHDLQVDGIGVITVVGEAVSTVGLPTSGSAFDPTPNGGWDAFVLQLNPSRPANLQITYSTFLGGFSDDTGRAVSVDSSGRITVAGYTRSFNFPVTAGAHDLTYNGGGDDAFVARLDPSRVGRTQLLYSTFLGGAFGDRANDVQVDAMGAATVAGKTSSSGFPTTAGGFATTIAGPTDAFVSRLDMLPIGARAFGVSSPGCAGPLAIGVTSMPQDGNANFALTCDHAPANANGGVMLGAAGLTTPIGVAGVQAWLDPRSGSFFLGTGSNQMGAASFAMPIPVNNTWLIGQKLYAQFFWLGPQAPAPCPPLGLSASNAIEITVQR